MKISDVWHKILDANKYLKMVVIGLVVMLINTQIISYTTKWEDEVTYKARYEEIKEQLSMVDEIDKKIALLESLSSEEFFKYFSISFDKTGKTKATFLRDERIGYISERSIYEQEYSDLVTLNFTESIFKDEDLDGEIKTLMDKTGFVSSGVFVSDASKRDARLNAYFGGTLFQDVKGHNQTKDYGNRNKVKDDLWTENKIYKINTIHHQAIKKLGDNLEAIGFSPVIEGCPSLQQSEFLTDKKYGDKTYTSFTEAFKHKSLPIVAFQYHPEIFNCEFAISEINKILE